MARDDVKARQVLDNDDDRRRRRRRYSDSSGSRERTKRRRNEREYHGGNSDRQHVDRYARHRSPQSPREFQRHHHVPPSVSASPTFQRRDNESSVSRYRDARLPETHDRRMTHRTEGSIRRRSRSKSPLRSPDPDYHRANPTRLGLYRSERPHRSQSQSPRRHGLSHRGSTERMQHSRKPLPSQDESYRGKPSETTGEVGPLLEKEKPNFKPTGLLADETNKVAVGSGNTVQNIVLKYHEPPEARKPPTSEPWVLYVFKGTSPDPLQTIQLHTRSCWLLGRELAVADIPVEHPSCSKQHAVFQFRHLVKKDDWGERKGKVGLYVLDLESSNGTILNGKRVEAARYTECLTGDVVKFGDSEREYVLLLPPK